MENGEGKNTQGPVLGAALFSRFFGEGRNDWLYIFLTSVSWTSCLFDLVAVVVVCIERSAVLQFVSATEINALCRDA